jgi:hypothetical protein
MDNTAVKGLSGNSKAFVRDKRNYKYTLENAETFQEF